MSERVVSSSFTPARRRAFSVVLAIELWERFGYYGMQAVLTIFMVEHLHMPDVDVNLMQGALGLLMYALPILGGVLGDQVLGTRQTLFCGAIGLTVGYLALACSLTIPALFLPSLTLIAVSNGLFKPNAGALVRQIYAGDGTALDAAFTLYYMSVNVGSTISMLLVPWLQQYVGPAIAFIVCAAGLLIGISYYKLRSAWLDYFLSVHQVSKEEAAAPVLISSVRSKRTLWCFLGLGLCGVWGSATLLLHYAAAMSCGVMVAALGLMVTWCVLYRRAARSERAGLLLGYLLSLQTMAYLVFYQQQQSSLTLFALRAVSGTYMIGRWSVFSMSAGQFQALNPLWIMVLSPVLAWSYQRRATAGREGAFPLKMFGGYMCVAFACLLLWWASVTTSGLVSPWIMVASYGAMSLGELLTMGLGLAIIARYVPARVNAVLMGSLYLLWGIGMYSGGLVANLAAVPGGEHIQNAHVYAPLFLHLFWGAVILCIVVLCMFPLMKRLTRQHQASM